MLRSARRHRSNENCGEVTALEGSTAHWVALCCSSSVLQRARKVFIILALSRGSCDLHLSFFSPCEVSVIWNRGATPARNTNWCYH